MHAASVTLAYLLEMVLASQSPVFIRRLSVSRDRCSAGLAVGDSWCVCHGTTCVTLGVIQVSHLYL